MVLFLRMTRSALHHLGAGFAEVFLEFCFRVFLARGFIFATVDVLRQKDVEPHEGFGDLNVFRGQRIVCHRSLHSLWCRKHSFAAVTW